MQIELISNQDVAHADLANDIETADFDINNQGGLLARDRDAAQRELLQAQEYFHNGKYGLAREWLNEALATAGLDGDE